jgi:hypothetical protein
VSQSRQATNGNVNTGGGGGGGELLDSPVPSLGYTTGGSGIVIIRYPIITL